MLHFRTPYARRYGRIRSSAEPRGGSWSGTGSILFAPDVILAGIDRVSDDGGTVEPATRLDIAKGDTSHWWPSFLPDGAHFLYFVRSASDDRRGVYVGGVDGADPGRLSAAADARTLGFSTADSTLYHPMMMSASSEVLAFASAQIPQGSRLEAVGRTGERLRLWEPQGQNWPRISNDGRRLARQRVHELRNTPDIWVEDLERGTNVRVTTAFDPDIMPVWSPDGRYLAYVSGGLPGRPGGERTLNIAAADGTGVFRSYKCPGSYCEPTDWSPDGTYLVINVIDERGLDVWKIPIDGTAAAPILAEPFAERDARISPNGRSIAYVSEESGRPEVSIRSLSGTPERIVASPDGGAQPVWRRDGSELFFVDLQGRLRSLSVRWSADRPAFGLPVRSIFLRSDSGIGERSTTCRPTAATSTCCGGTKTRRPLKSTSSWDGVLCSIEVAGVRRGRPGQVVHYPARAEEGCETSSRRAKNGPPAAQPRPVMFLAHIQGKSALHRQSAQRALWPEPEDLPKGLGLYLILGCRSQYRWPPAISPFALRFGGPPSRSTLPLN